MIRSEVEPQIPVGRRGTLRDDAWGDDAWGHDAWECVGVRRFRTEDTTETWEEYLLRGSDDGGECRLVAANGHWIFLHPCDDRPDLPETGSASYRGETYAFFRRTVAPTLDGAGDTPEDPRSIDDYVAPPRLLRYEAQEDAWWAGEYVEPDEVWQGFGLDGAPPLKVGVAPAQPSPYPVLTSEMRRAFFALLAVAVVIQVAGCVTAKESTVYEGSFDWTPGEILLSDVFTLEGRPANLRVTTHAEVDNAWAYFRYALVQRQTGQTLELAREVSSYHGAEETLTDRVFVPSVAPGPWVLRVEPETRMPALRFDVKVEHDVARLAFFAWALVLISIPYALLAFRGTAFEYERWQQGDVLKGTLS